MRGRKGPPVTDLLQAWADGHREAREPLFEEVYPELRRLAARALAGRGSGRPLDTTELAHETFMRLSAQRRLGWESRAHFYAHFATYLRRVLVDELRRRGRDKRGGRSIRVSLDHLEIPVGSPAVELLDLDAALTRLARIAPLAARVVELRFFTGLSLEDTAAALEVGLTTVKRKWRFSRAWLADRLSDLR